MLNASVALTGGPGIHRTVSVYNCKTGSVYPASSLGASGLFYGTIMAALFGPVGGIPYAVEGAIRAPAWLRFKSAGIIMRAGTQGPVAAAGTFGMMVPLGSYVAERCGMEPDSTAAQVIGVGLAVPPAAWASNSNWTRKRVVFSAAKEVKLARNAMYYVLPSTTIPRVYQEPSFMTLPPASG
ncbi:hypothetical protein DFH09DRAFT_1185483 [Mycena vulgaris]|nr:hypothetical protein DFH09DRAFT_1185483 [Mycena vulgaris]